jgi:hypothetical protein
LVAHNGAEVENVTDEFLQGSESSSTVPLLADQSYGVTLQGQYSMELMPSKSEFIAFQVISTFIFAWTQSGLNL